MGQGPEIKIIEPRIPRSVCCPQCGLRQPFRWGLSSAKTFAQSRRTLLDAVLMVKPAED
jgi:hypothetical protein